MRLILVGGDERFPYTAMALSEAGHETALIGNGGTPFSENALQGAGAVVLPYPVSRNGIDLNAPKNPDPIPLSRLFGAIPLRAPVLGGHFTEAIRKRARDLHVMDYEKDIAFLERNAAISADAAMEVLAKEKPALSGDVLLIGSGRFASALAFRLSDLQIGYDVLARNPGHTVPCFGAPLPLDTLSEKIGNAAVILNTVPAPLFSENILAKARPGTLFLELSAAGVIDAALCRRYGIRLVPCPALPARYAPQRAGYALADAVCMALSL